jgi:hypothetical protein
MGFDIERKVMSPNSGWEKIGFVEGKGNSTNIERYSFIDENPAQGTILYRLKQIDFDGTFKVFNSVSIEFEGVKEYSLEQNYPNPFNPSTVINYSVASAGPVKLTIYNMLGSEVVTLVNEYKEAGNHSVEFSTEKLDNRIGSGVYFYTINAGSFTQTRKMVVLK